MNQYPHQKRSVALEELLLLPCRLSFSADILVFFVLGLNGKFLTFRGFVSCPLVMVSTPVVCLFDTILLHELGRCIP